VVHIDDDAQASTGGVADRLVHALEQRFVNRVRRGAQRVGAPFNRQANGGETCFFDELKVIFFQGHAPRALGRSLERIAKINGASELPVAIRDARDGRRWRSDGRLTDLWG